MSAFTPPAGFTELDSLVEGFTVWGPAPAAPGAEAAPTSVKCPQCGASARFDPGLGALGCPFCGWKDSAPVDTVGTAASSHEFTHEALARGAEGFGVDRRELGCSSCGASIALDAGAMAATCPFCASPQVSIREHATVSGVRPSVVLPFAVQASACRGHAGQWLGEGWFHPADLGKLARVDAFTGIYLPYWMFSAGVRGSWRAEVGHERTVRRYDAREKRWENETVIDWRWEEGSVSIDVADLLVPGTTRISARLLDRIAPRFDLSKLATYDPRLLAGWAASTYDVPLPEAWDQGRHAIREQARERARASIASSHVRQFSLTADLRDEAWRHGLLPVWVSAYRYQDRTWVVLVDGATGAVAGQKPVAWWKVWTAIAVLLSPGLLTGLAGLPLLLVGFGVFVLILAAILLVAGGVGAAWVWSHATESEAE